MRIRFLLHAAAFLALGCSGEQTPSQAAPELPLAALDASLAASPVAVADAGKPIAEAHARALLSKRFRAAGLRIRYDVRVSGDGFELTSDGYDPAKRLGFEYLDPSEVETDVSAAETRPIERDGRVLLVSACSASELERRAARFLADKLKAELGDAGTQP